MRVDVIGGGPAGLYFAILTKKSLPQAEINVVERNRPDDTFGFGIVLSDETLNNLRLADEPSYRDIAANFAYWDDIYTWYKGSVMKSSGHGFSGINRLTLLGILQRRAAALGIEVKYQTESTDLASHRGADLVVAADGINSRVRESIKDELGATLEMRPNRFVWLGARTTLPGFTYSFRENADGIWNLHAYMYRPGECTLVVETTDEAFLKSGLGVTDERATAEYVRKLFAEELGGAEVLTNRSHWRQFPVVRCKVWHHDNVVLLGDAAHSAHWSIGSGTKLALEDAIGLHQAVMRHPHNSRAALAAYEKERREEAERIQYSANVSLVFFENVKRFWQMEPVQFNFALMSRAKQVTYENLKKRDEGFIRDVDQWWAKHVAATESIKLARDFTPPPPMFAPFTLRGMTVRNRVVVSPMCQYSAEDGTPNDWHMVHYGSRALGGAGLLFTEMTYVSPEGRISPGCTGLYKAEHVVAWKRIVDFVHAQSGAKFALQLGHAGRKGSTQLAWHEIDKPLPAGNWPIVAPSPLPYHPGESQVPRAMTRADMDKVRDDFVAATKMGIECGFDMLELHMAHGYLLATFISPITNQRARRVRRQAREPHAFSARGVRGVPRGMARGQADVGAPLGDRLDSRRPHRRRHGRDREGAQGARLRPHRRLHRPDRPGIQAGVRADVPGGVLRAGAQRGGHRHHGGGQHHQRRPGEHDGGLGPRGPRARWRGRIWPIRTSPCTPRRSTAITTCSGRSSISPARSRATCSPRAPRRRRAAARNW